MLRPIRPGAVRLIWWPRLTCRLRPSVAILIALLAFGAMSLLAPAPGMAQGVNNLLKFPPRPAPPPKHPEATADTPMLLQATEIRYDYRSLTIMLRREGCRHPEVPLFRPTLPNHLTGPCLRARHA